jgi:ubiquinone/menaquinone biosynthesis C-methylase UbiE
VIRGGREGYDRLQILARARWPDTADLLARVGVRPGMRCLDLGCGGGEVTFEIARLVGAEGRVTGVDIDEVKLSLGRESATQRGCPNVEFRAGNVTEWDEPAAYDLVYCRFLLQHLSRPVDLLRRMWAAVAPGGAIVVEDADFDGLFCHPPNDGFAFYARVYPRVLELHGGDGAIGRKLYRYFLEAAIPDPNLRLVQRVDAIGEAKTLSLSTLEATADAIVEAGLASVEEVNAAVADLATFTAEHGTVVGDPRIFQLWCSRPAPGGPAGGAAAPSW